ncbi:hypothetical protein EDB19DRAFT_1900951 [Suillus lakei]|nr:hypothetical protein EDB19DRAFT_1900951 [Suillus lakei]
MSDSETEPESDIPSSPEKACPLDPADVSITSTLSDTVAQLVNTPQTRSSEDPISAVNSAVKILESLDFSLIRKDASLYGTIQESSTTLIEFLNVVVTMCPTSAQDVHRMMESLAHILQPSFLNLMFQYRRLFHTLAVQELKSIAVVPIIISWVDAVLAKLGDVVSRVASAMYDRYFDDNLPEALRKRREEDNLRAAAQLPDRWDSVPSILTSEKASPAAKRLALRLLISRYVLQPQLALHPGVVDAPLDDRRYGLAAFLSHRLYAVHCGATLRVLPTTRATPIWLSGAHELRDAALTLVDLTTSAKDAETGVPFRPSQTVISPCPDLDGPRVVLVLWRHFVPWAWRLLAECNGSDSEIIIFLTTTWLHHAFDSDPQTTISTLATFTGDEHGKYIICAYLTYFSRLLMYLSSAPRPQNLTTAQTDVLLKTCQYFVHWSDLDLLGIRKSSDCCRYLTLLFVYLSCIENGHDASDHITHAMARMQPRSLRDGWKLAVQQESSKLNDEQLLEDKPDKNQIRRAKQFLDFLTIECFSNVQISNQKLIIEFLEATMEYLRRESAEERLPSFSTSFLSCLTAFQRGQPGIKVCDAPSLSDAESIWQVALDSATPDLALASSFALHIILSRRLPEPLTQVEAWDFLRNVLLMISSQDYLGDESPLALVVNPTICDALSQLLRNADEHTGVHIPRNTALESLIDNYDP